MKKHRLSRAAGTLLVAMALCSPLAARADDPVADPGFCFVDVNGDHLYSASQGDIGLASAPSVDVNALILNDGAFNTQVDEAPYDASYWSKRSLVVPASQSISVSGAMVLKAGKDVFVYGTLSADTIFIQACNEVDMTRSSSTFNTAMTVDAGGNVYLDGASVSGMDPASRFKVMSDKNIYARPEPISGFVTVVSAGIEVTLDADYKTILENAVMFANDGLSSMNIYGDKGVDATSFSVLGAGDLLRMKTSKGSINYTQSFGSAVNILLDAAGSCQNQNCRDYRGCDRNKNDNRRKCGQKQDRCPRRDRGCDANETCCHQRRQCDDRADRHARCNHSQNRCEAGQHGPVADVNVTDSALSATGTLQMFACTDAIGNSSNTSLFGGTIDIDAGRHADFSNSSMTAFAANLSIEAQAGSIKVDGVNWSAINGISIVADENLSMNSAYLVSDGEIELAANGGTFSGASSSVTSAGDPAATLSAYAKKDMDIFSANWMTSAAMLLKSKYGDIKAPGGSFQAVGSPGTVMFYAGGKDVDVSGSVLTGIASYGPTGVVVVGP